MLYLAIEYLHVLGAIVILGTGTGPRIVLMLVALLTLDNR